MTNSDLVGLKLTSFRTKLSLSAALGCILLSACTGGLNQTSETIKKSSEAETLFTEVFDVIPFEDRKRRKFDNPVIADLDQDGRQDVVINEHGREMRIFWNDGDTFSTGPKIANGDVHGAAVADFDENGKLDLVITQGGGDGGNPRRPLWVEVDKDRSISQNGAFDYFEPGRGRAAKFMNSPDEADLNLLITGFPMPAQREKGANHYYDNVGGGDFVFQDHLPEAGGLGFRASLTDYNSDGNEDVLFFGASRVIVAKGLSGGKFEDATSEVFGGVQNIKDISAITEIDFDNDGDQDLFITRSEFQFDLEEYYDAATKRFAFLSFRKDFLLEDITVTGDLVLENLQRTYPHYDLFMGANKTPYTFTGDPHGHQDITINIEEAKGFPEGEIKGGLYIGYIGDGKWRIGGQTQSRIAATIANVIEAPDIKPQPDLPVFLLENDNGKFVDATRKLGFSIDEQTTGAAAGDLNNDGWPDLAVLRYGNMAKPNDHLLFLNDGGKGFNLQKNAGIMSNEVGTTGGSIEAFDYDSNGAVDLLYANERGRWHLLKNTMSEAQDNAFVIIKLQPRDGFQNTLQGAVVTLTACGQTQSRKVGSSSSAYSQNLNTDLHFGLGDCSEVETARVRWGNGESKTFAIDDVNTAIVIRN